MKKLLLIVLLALMTGCATNMTRPVKPVDDKEYFTYAVAKYCPQYVFAADKMWASMTDEGVDAGVRAMGVEFKIKAMRVACDASFMKN